MHSSRPSSPPPTERIHVLALRAIALSVMVLSLSLGASPASASSFHLADITARDGVVLTGNVFIPDTPGPHPAILFITSWARPNLESLAQAQQFADAGYVDTVDPLYAEQGAFFTTVKFSSPWGNPSYVSLPLK